MSDRDAGPRPYDVAPLRMRISNEHAPGGLEPHLVGRQRHPAGEPVRFTFSGEQELIAYY